MIEVDPADGMTPLDDAEPLVRAAGGELGLRTSVLSGLRSTLSGWILDPDSELLFVATRG